MTKITTCSGLKWPVSAGLQHISTTIKVLACSTVFLLSACDSATSLSGESTTDETLSLGATTSIYQPPLLASWYADMTYDPTTNVDVDVYLVDMFQMSTSRIFQLKSQGTHVMCYFSAGVLRSTAPDANRYPAETLGNAHNNSTTDKWLNTENLTVRNRIRERISLAQARQCDGILVGDLDAHRHNTGFSSISYNGQISYARWLADNAHSRGLAIGMAGNQEQAKNVANDFEFAFAQNCYQSGSCSSLSSFSNLGKAVLIAEDRPWDVGNASSLANFCQHGVSNSWSVNILPTALDGSFTASCPTRNGTAVVPTAIAVATPATVSGQTPEPTPAPTPEPEVEPEPVPTPESQPELAPSPEFAPEPEPAPISVPQTPIAGRYQPTPGATWQWQLQGNINTSYNVDVYNIDLFDNSASFIANLQAQGRKVICYFSAGTYEQWRSDASLMTSAVRGNNLDDWPGERWLDIRSSVARNVMSTRLDLARSKGCDAVEPDNVDVHTQTSGFNISYNDMINYNRFLASEAHARGLSIALKNNLGQVNDLVSDYDFAINESCYRYNECDALRPFIDQNKAVFQAEYLFQSANEAFQTFCNQLLNIGLSPIALNRALDGSLRLSCQ